MTITKTKIGRVHAEQKKDGITFHGFGNNAGEAIGELAKTMRCPKCGYEWAGVLHHVASEMGKRGAAGYRAKVPLAERVANAKKGGVARWKSIRSFPSTHS